GSRLVGRQPVGDRRRRRLGVGGRNRGRRSLGGRSRLGGSRRGLRGRRVGSRRDLCGRRGLLHQLLGLVSAPRRQRPARQAKRVGILTGGGDCPGLNAVIRAVARRSFEGGWEVIGLREGWKGLVENIAQELGPQAISGILPRGGTILGTSRTNPYKLDAVDQ